MKRISSKLIAIGIPAVFVAAAIWFFYGHHGLYAYGYGRWSMPYGNYGHYGFGRWFMPYGGMMTGGGGIVMIFFWIILLVALAYLISGLFGRRSDTPAKPASEPDALEILKRRYARGEIDRAEFESKQRDLKSSYCDRI